MLARRTQSVTTPPVAQAMAMAAIALRATKAIPISVAKVTNSKPPLFFSFIFLVRFLSNLKAPED